MLILYACFTGRIDSFALHFGFLISLLSWIPVVIYIYVYWLMFQTRARFWLLLPKKIPFFLFHPLLKILYCKHYSSLFVLDLALLCTSLLYFKILSFLKFLATFPLSTSYQWPSFNSLTTIISSINIQPNSHKDL